MPRSEALRRAAAAALLVGLMAVAWSGLFADPGPGRAAALCALGALPALAMLSPRRPVALAAVAAAAALPAALALAAGVSPFALVTLDRDAWSTVGGVLPDGLRSAAETPLPLLPGASPVLGALYDAALAAGAALIAWQVVVRRRTLLGVVVVGVALAYRWTVVPPGDAVLEGALALAVALAALALDPGRGAARGRPARGLGLAAGAVCVAAVLGAGPLAGSQGWWDWRSWSVAAGPATPPAPVLDLQQRYGRLDWPARPTVVVRVSGDRPLPLRAAVLDRFDGVAFTASPGAAETVPRDGATLTVPGSAPGPGGVVQRVTLSGADSAVLLAGGRPVTFTGPFTGTASVAYGAVRVDPALPRGTAYTVRTRVPQPTPAELVGRRAYATGEVGPGLTDVTAGYGGARVGAPLWGTGPAPAPARYGAYAGLARQARRLADGASSPYVAVNRIESWLRGTMTYDEQPPYPPPGVPPLADFVDRTHRGFCQHFAGAMALMLRTLGIPARVDVGYAQGHWDARRADWEVWDRDAHSWVDVLLPGAGWLPFDPTPGRSAPNPASVSSPDYAPAPRTVRAAGLERRAVRAPAPSGPPPRPARPVPAPAAAPASSRDGDGRGWTWALLALAALPLAVPGAKLARGARRRRSGDERERVLAAVRELESRLGDLDVPVDPAAAPAERAAAVRAAVGVDVADLYARAARARYGSGPTPRGQAARAWRELGDATRALRRRVPLARRVRGALRPGGLRRPRRAAR